MSSIPNSSMEEEGEKTRSTIEWFEIEMLEQMVENKRRIDLLNEQLEINQRKMHDLQARIKSSEEKFEVQQQRVQYVQKKAESIEWAFSSYPGQVI